MSGSGGSAGNDYPRQPGSFLNTQDGSEHYQIIKAMNAIRDLRIKGFDPPQLVVCGAQSAGKSSVLSAITRIAFPSKDGICTRYVIKVTLAYGEKASLTAKIVPGPSPKKRRDKLKSFKWPEDPSDASRMNPSACIEAANEAIFPNDEGRAKSITDDVLSIQITGRDQRALELVDLPGLIGNSEDEDTVERVEKLVLEYVKSNNSTILAVIDGKNDLQTGKIITWCKKHAVERTLCIVTKPDLASDSQCLKIVDAAKHEHEEHHYNMFDWHILKNLDSAAGSGTSDRSRDKEEEDFFHEKPWDKLPREKLGIAHLRTELRRRYFTAAKQGLPKFEEDIKKRLMDKKFDILTSRMSDDALTKTFKAVTDRLKTAAHDHAKGTYAYSTNMLGNDGAHNLRSRIRECDRRFRNTIVEKGHTWNSYAHMQPLDKYHELSCGRLPDTRSGKMSSIAEPEPANREKERNKISDMLSMTGGTELEGFYSPDRISKVIWELSTKWLEIAESHVEDVFDCCKQYFEVISKIEFPRTEASIRRDEEWDGFSKSMSDIVAKRYVEEYVIPKLEKAKKAAEKELWLLEEDRQDWQKNLDIRFLVDQKMHRQNAPFPSAIDAMRSQQNGTRVNGIGNHEMNPSVLSEQRKMSRPEHYRDYKAEDYLHAAQSHYVVEERHFLRKIHKLIPDDLNLDAIKMLAKEEEASVRDMDRLAKEKKKLEDAGMGWGLNL
ncbi:dynamin family protein [Colletotrichum kahawae]|uniref:Dynamin family protein n=1 Tax=Colletotrichum kahawae TaxID=34407 RepID=A0AAD9YSG6_COLKA|nr:dynamin family protein [Colletotrichum kahawae]